MRTGSATGAPAARASSVPSPNARIVLDHRQRVSLARAPDGVEHIGIRGALGPGGEDAHQRIGALAAQRRHGQRFHHARPRELRDHRLEALPVFGLLVPDRRHHENARLRHSPRHRREQPPRHVVGPVHVLQHEHQRRRRGPVVDDTAHRLEQSHRFCAGRRLAGLRDFREEAGELRPVRCAGCGQRGRVTDQARPEQLDPGPEHEVAVALVAVSNHHASAFVSCAGAELVHQPGLAHACFPGDHHHAPAPGRRVVDETCQSRHLRISPHQRWTGGR